VISNCFVLKQIKSGKYYIQNNTLADYLGFVETGIFHNQEYWDSSDL
jgi:hypothetical protein